jgi:hypothetical protein
MGLTVTRLAGEALTLEQHRALDLTRPYTDPPHGADPTQRATDAACSAIFDEPGIAQPGWTKPPRHERIDL